MGYIIGILVLGFLVFVHELGHFTAAKWFKMPVTAFALGFGPALFKFRKGETDYRLNAIPLGGYVQIVGEGDDKSDNPLAFNNQSSLKKFVVLAAGIVFNLVSSFLIMLILVVTVGVPTKTVEVVSLQEKTHAIEFLKEGDRITSVNGHAVNTDNYVSVGDWIKEKQEGATLEIIRDSEKMVFDIPLTDWEDGRKIIGMTYSPTTVFTKEGNVAKSIFITPFKETGEIVKLIFQGLKMMVTGQVSSDDVAGPIGIVKTTGDIAKTSIPFLFYWIAILGINLGLMNAMPIPALDGGQIFFLFLEKFILKEKWNKKVANRINVAFFTVLFGIMILITVKDIIQLF